LTSWARRLYQYLCTQERQGDANIDNTITAAVNSYCDWKVHVLVDPDRIKSVPSGFHDSVILLQKDSMICRIFYSILKTIQLVKDSASTLQNQQELEKLEPQRTGYRTVTARRIMEQKSQVQEDYVRMETKSHGESMARIRLQRRNVPEPTFRDVVEEMAKERGILFQPRMGANSRKDGKQIFLFGSFPIYMEGDVVFCFQDSTWKPVSLDQLVESAAN